MSILARRRGDWGQPSRMRTMRNRERCDCSAGGCRSRIAHSDTQSSNESWGSLRGRVPRARSIGCWRGAAPNGGGGRQRAKTCALRLRKTRRKRASATGKPRLRLSAPAHQKDGDVQVNRARKWSRVDGRRPLSGPRPFGPVSVFSRTGMLVRMIGRRLHEQGEEAHA